MSNVCYKKRLENKVKLSLLTVMRGLKSVRDALKGRQVMNLTKLHAQLPEMANKCVAQTLKQMTPSLKKSAQIQLAMNAYQLQNVT